MSHGILLLMACRNAWPKRQAWAVQRGKYREVAQYAQLGLDSKRRADALHWKHSAWLVSGSIPHSTRGSAVQSALTCLVRTVQLGPSALCILFAEQVVCRHGHHLRQKMQSLNDASSSILAPQRSPDLTPCRHTLWTMLC